MTSLYIETSVYEDLDEIAKTNEDEAADIEVSLEEIYDNPSLYGHLNEKGFRNVEAPTFDVDWFRDLHKDRLNVYRLKIWYPNGALSQYRVIYASDVKHDCFHVLAVIPRSIEYDIQHPTLKRVRADYERLGLLPY